MIVDLPETTTGEVARRLVHLREEGGAVALGRVLTLVIDADAADVEDAVAVTNDVSREHPMRVIVLARDAATGAGPRVDAQIRVGGDAGASEVVLLRASGEMLEHADTLVVPLLLPDAPIVVWWPREIPARPAAHPIGQMAQRRITDSLACSDPIGTLERLRDGYTDGDTDLAWTRLTVWRGLLAAAFDLPPYEPVTAARITGDASHPSLHLLGAWLALSLDCPVEVVGAPDAVGITQVRLERPSGPLEIDRPDGRRATLRHPGQPVRHLAMPLRELRECLSEDLRRMDADEVYGEVLRDGLARVLP
ncbi:MAG: glucose-6-phosphate dehydrogenase assembly protein OpcA [Actinomycetales bacterium]|jgi:glucose-6-phosphate dehydrogenase assembly protein OpcA|nr:glucose-6-phosphate dehydrogenase assembly protein OpcA [Actinomycetales bacterium]